jgi:hypothetical protein
MTPASFRCGPFLVSSDASWPSVWHAYAAAVMLPADETTWRMPLRAVLGRVDDNALDVDYSAAVEHLDVRITAEGHHIHAASVEADVLDGTMTVHIKAFMDSPHITIGNALRALSSVVMPTVHDGLMLHASSVVFAGQGLAFAGVSTAGKTTMALGFREGRFLSDDISLVRHLSSSPRVGESPFYGSAGVRGLDDDAPLRAMVLLGKSPSGTTIERVKPSAAMGELLRHVVNFSTDVAVTEAMLARVQSLVAAVPVVRVHRDLSDGSDAIAQKILNYIND